MPVEHGDEAAQRCFVARHKLRRATGQLNRRGKVVPRLGTLAQVPGGARCRLAQSGGPGFEPPVELRRACNEENFPESAPVQGERLPGLLPSHRALESDYVARNLIA